MGKLGIRKPWGGGGGGGGGGQNRTATQNFGLLILGGGKEGEQGSISMRLTKPGVFNHSPRQLHGSARPVRTTHMLERGLIAVLYPERGDRGGKKERKRCSAFSGVQWVARRDP